MEEKNNVTEISLDDLGSNNIVIEKAGDNLNMINTDPVNLEPHIEDLELLVDPNKSLHNSPVQTSKENSFKSLSPKMENMSENISDVKLDGVNLLDKPNIDFSMNVTRNAPKSNETSNFFQRSVNKVNKSSHEDLVEKQELLFKLKRFESRGIPLSNHFSSSSKIEDMREEYGRIKKQRDLENSIKFQRKTMMAFSSGVEFMNSKFDPFDIKLDGWSESLHENLTDYDDVFEELHEKYKTRAKIAPELKLLMMLGGSAAMFHMTNSFFKSAMPNMDDVLKQNPDLARQFANAAVSSATQNNPGLGNVMGDMINETMNVRSQQQVPVNQYQMPNQMSNQMSGPDDQDVERILNQIKEFRDDTPNDKVVETPINTPSVSQMPVPQMEVSIPQVSKNIVASTEVVKRKRGRPPKSKTVPKPDTASFALNL